MDVTAGNLRKEHHYCPCCNGCAIVVGVNDLWHTHESIAVLLDNPDDGYMQCWFTYSFKLDMSRVWRVSPKQIDTRCYSTRTVLQ